MLDKQNKREQLIEDFKSLENKAKELYPDIEKVVFSCKQYNCSNY